MTCILFTVVSWSGLFINRNLAPARVAIGVIPVLIMLNLETLGELVGWALGFGFCQSLFVFSKWAFYYTTRNDARRLLFLVDCW